MSEDDLMFWQDVLDEIMSGRPPSPCPFCKAPGLKIEARGALTRIECTACRRYLEGRFANEGGAPGPIGGSNDRGA